MLDRIAECWLTSKLWLAARAVAPAMEVLHLHDPSLHPDAVAEATMYAVLQISIIAFVFRPLETLAPAESWDDRELTKIDRLYTLIMLLGLFPLFSYLVLEPFGRLFSGSEADTTSAVHGLRLWVPWFDRHTYVLLAVYYLLYDFTYYWMHRTQHLIPWWWALHSMHHSQRQLSCWSNDRGNYLDGALQSFILAAVGVVAGIDIEDFALLTLVSELVQNFSHTNTRIGFGNQKLIVDPAFHRLHHMVADPARPGFHNCNFGQVLSIWDVVFGTALYGEPVHPTGVGDPVIDADNGRGLVSMQWHTLKRFWGAFKRPAGWRLGDVSFGADYAPIHD